MLMAGYINDPDYWWYRAEEYRAKADSVQEFEAGRALIRAAEACERQARLLEANVVSGDASIDQRAAGGAT